MHKHTNNHRKSFCSRGAISSRNTIVERVVREMHAHGFYNDKGGILPFHSLRLKYSHPQKFVDRGF
jgi:hypothetical protein